MNWNDSLQRILDDVLAEAADDLVGLWLVCAWVRDAFASWTSAAIREATLEVISRAIANGGVLVGSFVESGFELWSPHFEALPRIEATWASPDHTPNLFDNVWLSGRDLDYRVVDVEP